MNTTKQLCFLSILFMHSIGAMHNSLINKLNELNRTLAMIKNELGKVPPTKIPSEEPLIKKYTISAHFSEPLISALETIRNNATKASSAAGIKYSFNQITSAPLGRWENITLEDAAKLNEVFKTIFDKEQLIIKFNNLNHKKSRYGDSLTYSIEVSSDIATSEELEHLLALELKDSNLSNKIKLKNDSVVLSSNKSGYSHDVINKVEESFNTLHSDQKKAPITSLYELKDSKRDAIWKKTTSSKEKGSSGLFGWFTSKFGGSSESETNIIELYEESETAKKLKEAEKKLKEAEMELEEELKKEQDRIAREEEEAKRIREAAIELAALEEARLKLEAERLEEARKEEELLKKLTESKEEHKETPAHEPTSKWPLDYAEIQKAKIKLDKDVYANLIKTLKNIEKENVHTYIFKEGNKIKQVIFEGENKGGIEYETDADINFLLKPYLNHYRDRITTGVFIKEEPTKNIVIKNEALKQLLGL